MVLFLHIRSFYMDICALILLGSLPAAWFAAVCVLVFLLLVIAILFILKSREANMLKNEVMELRDTMRMMRYEEANLARMLHTASKPTGQPITSDPLCEEGAYVMDGSEKKQTYEDATSEESLGRNEQVNEDVSALASAVVPSDAMASEEVIQETALEQSEEQQQDITIEENPLMAETIQDMLVPENEGSPLTNVEDIQVVISQPHKQAINERRPAIPTDLFSAWFAENESLSLEDTIDAENVKPDVEVLDDNKAILLTQESMADYVSHECVAQTSIEVLETQDEVDAVTNHDESPSLSKEDERFCRKLERIVNTRLRNPNLNIDIIAAQLGLGRTNFYRKVRELMGMSPNDYLRKCRMERAAEMLCNSELAINDVCAQVGMPDAQYFSRVFKAYYGVSPSVYREKQSKLH